MSYVPVGTQVERGEGGMVATRRQRGRRNSTVWTRQEDFRSHRRGYVRGDIGWTFQNVYAQITLPSESGYLNVRP